MKDVSEESSISLVEGQKIPRMVETFDVDDLSVAVKFENKYSHTFWPRVAITRNEFLPTQTSSPQVIPKMTSEKEDRMGKPMPAT